MNFKNLETKFLSLEKEDKKIRENIMDFISVWHWVSVGNLIGLIYIHTMLSKDIDRLQRKILKLEMKLNGEL